MEPLSDDRVYPAIQLAEILGVPVHRVRHILHTRSHIKPAVTVENLRFYRPDALAMLRHELNADDARRAA